MAVRNLKASQLNGRHIYQSENRTVYSDMFMKDYGYIINDENANEYYNYSIRGIESVIAFLTVIIITGKRFWIAAGLGILIYVILTVLFYKSYLKKCQVITNFKKTTKENYIVTTAKDMSYTRLLLVIGICALIIIITIYGVKSGYYVDLKRNLFVAASILAGAFALLHLAVLIYKAINHIKTTENK